MITKKKVPVTSISRTSSPVVAVSAGRGGSGGVIGSGGGGGVEKLVADTRIDPTRPKAEAFEGAETIDAVGDVVDRVQPKPIESEYVSDCPTFAPDLDKNVDESPDHEVKRKVNLGRIESDFAKHNGKIRCNVHPMYLGGAMIEHPIDADGGSAHACTDNAEEYKDVAEITTKLSEPVDDTVEVKIEVTDAKSDDTETKCQVIGECSGKYGCSVNK